MSTRATIAPRRADDERALLEAPTDSLPGIGPTLAQRLAERDLRTVEDLLWFVPRRYDDARDQRPLARALAEAEDGARVTLGGVILASRFHQRGRKRWLDVRLGDLAVPAAGEQAAQILVRWFNARASMATELGRGCFVVLSGRLARRGLHAEMANPDIVSVTSPAGVSTRATAPIIPRHGEIPGVQPARVRKACLAALDRAGAAVRGAVPPEVTARLGLAPLGEAMARLHRPPPELAAEDIARLNEGTSEWHRRLVFEDLFLLGLAVALRRRARRHDRALPCPVPADRANTLARALPFSLTRAQERAVDAVAADLARDVPMSRLLQGDVGSGKTAVAFAAAHHVVSAGLQAAFMAPTELLAEQHAGTLSRWCQAVGLRSALLTASTPTAERRDVLRALDDGSLQLVIGTHALLSENVSFAALGLVIIDEQHRFGVAQRVELRDKGARGAAPHLLVMTATPIPRTLALTAYGDLDVTVIDELPPGRVAPTTLVLAGAAGRERAHALVRERLAAGERAYVVCPLIEQSDDDDRVGGADAVSTAERLRVTFAPARVGLVHGRMPQAERDQTMQRFRAGELEILVATTVIEVGVDVPQATVMVVLDAQRFGLAQLHQLRGRVGRGGGASHCLLMTRGAQTPEAARRLAVMAQTCDGFRIAEADLAIRGPGELLGVRQAGLPRLRFGELHEHADLLALARDAADALLASDPDLSRPEHAITRRVLAQRTAGLAIYGAESG